MEGVFNNEAIASKQQEYFMKMKQVIVSGLFFSALSLSAVAGKMELKTAKGSSTISNGLIKATISAGGGKVTLLQDLKNSNNYTMNKSDGDGLGKSRIYENLRYDELIKATYRLTTVRNNSKTIAIRTDYTATNKRNKLAGFEFTKTYSVNKDEARLIFDYMIKPHESVGKFSPFIHNQIQLPSGKNFAFSQTGKGLFCKSTTPVKDMNSNNFISDLLEPWGAIISPESATGIVVVSDAGKLKEFFIWLGNEQYSTIEPLFNQQIFSAGGIWKAKMYYILVNGLKSCHFATPEYAAGFCKENGKSVLKFFPAITMNKTIITVSLNNKKIVEHTVTAVAGKCLTLPVNLPEGMNKVKIKVASATVNNSHEVFASTKIMTGQVKSRAAVYNRTGGMKGNYAKASMDTKQAYVSPNISSFLSFVLLNKLAKGKQLDMVVETPAEIEFLTAVNRNAKSQQMKSEKITVDGKPYVRYTIFNCYRRLTLFNVTTMKPGSTGTIYYYAKWAGGEQPKQSIKVASISIRRAPLAKRLTSCLGWMPASIHIEWPDFHKSMKYIGANTVTSVSHDHNKDTLLQETADAARQAGLYYAANFSPFGGFLKKDLAEDKNACAISITGKTSKWLCPSFRGKAFKNEIKRAANAGNHGISRLWLDCEFWGGSEYCFCERCMKRFKTFMAKKYPKLKYMSPLVFMKKRSEYPEYDKVWNAFKAVLGDEMYGALAKKYKENLKNSGKSSGSYQLGTYGAKPGNLYSHFFSLDSLLDHNIMTIAQPSAYAAGDALVVAETVKNVRAVTGKSNIITWLSAGFNVDFECEPVEFRYCLLENFLNGASGFTMFTWYGCDAMDMKELAEAMRMVVPVEDIIVDGKVIKGLKTSNPAVKICGLVNKDEKLILLSEYYQIKNTPVSFEIKVAGKSRAINMRTGQVIAELKAGVNTINAVIPANDRALLIYIGTREFSFAAPEVTTIKLDKKVVDKTLPAAILGKGGKRLMINEDKRQLTIANSYYKILFDKRNRLFSEILFKNGGTVIKKYLTTNFLKPHGERPNQMLERRAKMSFSTLPDGSQGTLTITGNFTSKAYNVDYSYKATFYASRPVVRIEATVKQNNVFNWELVRLNQWQPFFRQGKKSQTVFPYWSVAEPFRSGSFAETKGGIKPGNWRKGYRWIAAFNNKDALGLITFGKDKPFIYVYNKDRYYMNGSYGEWNSNERSVDQYIYIGPVGDQAKVVGEWAAKLMAE
jgi:hypothetical protein